MKATKVITRVRHKGRVMALLALCALLAASGTVQAQPNSDIANTRHNLSVSGPGEVTATSQSSICVFCHTPHSSNATIAAPLWNRDLSQATYDTYDSASIQADDIAEPIGSSRLCLSCHDGTLAIGSVRNEPGRGGGDGSISMQGTAGDGTMPADAGATTGNTRDLGVNLTNDHPISFTYDSTLADADGELRDPSAVDHIGIRPGNNPLLPLEPDSFGDGQLQCTTCHDPHVLEEGAYNKFLRVSRFQSAQAGSSFDAANDQICLGCHDKEGLTWAESAHADPAVADETYKDGAADMRQFPRGLQVWEVGCLNCHNPHTTEGARRLLREGTDAAGTFDTPKAGGDSAIEETCYQCHTTSLASSVEGGTGTVPDIETEFGKARRMPITTADQPATVEVHDILDADFTETQATLGLNNLNNRHAECTDCHNPHRLMRDSLFNGSRNDGRRTHVVGGPTGNLASGVLRGTFGVEPSYSGESFFDLPIGYNVKRGDGGTGADTTVTNDWVTREYQICLKCHSDFAYDDDNVYPSGSTRPELGGPGLTSAADTQRNNYTRYTNQAREFQAPELHKGNPAANGAEAGADSSFDSGNHRSWHPVMDVTGRTTGLRNGMNSGSFNAPWNANVGNQTMYCTDCHGPNTQAGEHEPAAGQPWGPHGSSNNFILKGEWDTNSGQGNSNTLCFKCHSESSYGNGGGGTGFQTDRGDGHMVHSPADKVESPIRCNWCHVAVPHGWKNKALLVNLNDVGPEAGLSPGTEVSENYDNGPYYRNAFLKVQNFVQDADWADTDCGSDSGEIGKTWMTETCMNPP